MKIKLYECVKCNDKIYSRTQHDFISCKCGVISVDGGNFHDSKKEIWAPFRLIGNLEDFKLENEIIELNVSVKDLYDDWNCNINKYGHFD